MTRWASKSQATGAARSDLDDVGDWLLPGFIVASFPAPVSSRSATNAECAT
jgi:hypothetical protein